MVYNMMTTKFNIVEFSSIEACVEEMKKNGWKYRRVWFISDKNHEAYEQKITIDTEGNVSIGKREKFL